MQGLTKIFLGVGLVGFSGVVLAQNTPAPPPPNATSYAQPSGPQNPGGTPQPVVDAASNVYLPWIGKNEQVLINYADFFYQLEKGTTGSGSGAYMAPITALANTQLVTTTKGTLLTSIILSSLNLQNALPSGDEGTLNSATYATMLGSDIQPPGSLPQDDYTFNADNILGGSGYEDKDKGASIRALVVFLSGSTSPAGLTFSKDDKTRKQQLAGSDVQSYLLRSRTAAAGQSVSFSNLNYLARERAIVKDLGKQAGMTTLPTDGAKQDINDASQLQLEQFLVDRRVGNASWYTSVNTASAITVQRETLFVLAEIEKQMFQQKILMERMLAAQAVTQEQTAEINRTKLDYDRQTVQKSLAE
jgi:hypothetical protein